ncbi:MAG: amidohydrolase family protein [Phycisphaerae bacterium]
MKLDVLIRGGTVYDGLSAAGRLADVGVLDGRIVLPQRGADVQAGKVLDAAGKAVMPGFIDIHTHSELAYLIWPNATSKLLSGVTTDVAGNCGSSAFPLLGDVLRRRQADNAKYGLSIDWTDAAGYFARLEATPCSVNRAVLVGHGNLRGSVVGYDNRPATRQERDAMRKLLEDGLAQGAFGMSSGLIYPPGIWANTEELAELATAVRAYGGFYSSHIRGEGATLLEAVDEFIAVLERSGCRGQLSHIKTSGRRHWDKLPALKQRLDSALDRGVNLMADRYPYTASCTSLSTTVLPEWAEEGTREAIIARLKSPAERARIVADVAARDDADTLFGDVRVIGFGRDDLAELAGKSLEELGRLRKLDPIQATLDLMIEDELRTEVVHFCMSERNMEEIYRWPMVMVGSDYGARDALADGEGCHPRAFGTPAAFLQRLVREKRICDWPTAARKLSTMAADMLGLPDRGRIAAGCWADLTVLDPQTVADRATYDKPRQTPAGIEHVLVNGVIAVESGGFTGALAGQVLRRR